MTAPEREPGPSGYLVGERGAWPTYQHAELFERAAARWTARLILEGRAMTLSDVQLAVAALCALRGAELDAGAQALAVLCAQYGQLDAADVLERGARACSRY